MEKREETNKCQPELKRKQNRNQEMPEKGINKCNGLGAGVRGVGWEERGSVGWFELNLINSLVLIVGSER